MLHQSSMLTLSLRSSAWQGFFLFCLVIFLNTGQAAAGLEQYTYDALGRLATITYPNGSTIAYAYDAAGNRKTTGPIYVPPPPPPATYTDNFTLVQGTLATTGPMVYGYATNLSGASLSPAQLSGGKTITNFIDLKVPPAFAFLQTVLAISGFSADPTKTWLVSATAGSSNRTGANASSYSYSGGLATWIWSSPAFPAMGFTGSGAIACSVVHK